MLTTCGVIASLGLAWINRLADARFKNSLADVVRLSNAEFKSTQSKTKWLNYFSAKEYFDELK